MQQKEHFPQLLCYPALTISGSQVQNGQIYQLGLLLKPQCAARYSKGSRASFKTLMINYTLTCAMPYYNLTIKAINHLQVKACQARTGFLLNSITSDTARQHALPHQQKTSLYSIFCHCTSIGKGESFNILSTTTSKPWCDNVEHTLKQNDILGKYMETDTGQQKKKKNLCVTFIFMQPLKFCKCKCQQTHMYLIEDVRDILLAARLFSIAEFRSVSAGQKALVPH